MVICCTQLPAAVKKVDPQRKRKSRYFKEEKVEIVKRRCPVETAFDV